VEARDVLSPSRMRRPARLRETNNEDVRVAWVGGAIPVALPLRRIGELDAEPLRSWAPDIAFATGVIEELELNTRIGSKAAD
jgi:hypothetical protein